MFIELNHSLWKLKILVYCKYGKDPEVNMRFGGEPFKLSSLVLIVTLSCQHEHPISNLGNTSH